MAKKPRMTHISSHQAEHSPQTAIANSPAAGRSARLAFSPAMRDALSFNKKRYVPTPDEIREMYGPAVTLGAPEDVRMAMDSALADAGFYSLVQHGLDMGVYGSMSNFMGYAALQNVAQNGLIRACIETVTDDMTRNWIELTREGATDDQDENGRDDKLDEIVKEFDRLELQKVMHEACALTGYYGGCLLFLDTGADGEYLKHPLNLDPLFSLEARNPGFLKAVRPIDPINVFPGTYNAIDPLKADYYRPTTWWVLGRQVHASRLIRIVANEAPLIYKPSYNFLGIPQAQVLWDYVLHFQQNRDAANRLLNKFSMLVFKTAMGDLFQGGGLDQLDTRMQILARNQSNDGVFAIDRENEDVVKVETPLGGVTDIVKQSLEQLAAMNRTPAVKLLGISPSGFNATGESDIRNYYDHILSQQEKVLRPAIKDVLDVVQISLFGEIDGAIDFTFKALSEDDKSAVAMTQQTKATTLCSLIDRDVISPEEARKVLVADPSSGLNDLDPDDIPIAPDVEMGPGGALEQPLEVEQGGAAPEGPEAEQPEVVEEGKEQADDVEKVILNGAQVGSMVDIVSKVAAGELPRDSGMAILQAAFPITEEVAEQIIGSAGLQQEGSPEAAEGAEQGQPVPMPASSPFAADAAPEGEVEFRSLENGQPFPIHKGETIKEAAEKFIAKKQAQKAASSGSKSGSLPTVTNKKGDPISYQRAESGKSYVDRLQTAKQSVKKYCADNDMTDTSWRVDVHDADDYDKNTHTYHTDGGSCFGVSQVTDDYHTKGDIVSVCVNKENGERGSDLMKMAVANGGDRLDSFDGNHSFYTRCGFEPVSWVKFDDEYAPEEWKALNPGFKPGMPDKDLRVPREDVIFYRYTGKKSTESADDFKKRVAASASYDEAKDARNAAIEKGE